MLPPFDSTFCQKIPVRQFCEDPQFRNVIAEQVQEKHFKNKVTVKIESISPRPKVAINQVEDLHIRKFTRD